MQEGNMSWTRGSRWTVSVHEERSNRQREIGGQGLQIGRISLDEEKHVAGVCPREE